MHPVRRRKLTWWLFILSVIILVTLLIMYALRQNISLFYTPTQLVMGEASKTRMIRLGGMVVTGSVTHTPADLSVQFKLTDYNQTILVSYQGSLPDLFREGQGIVALGWMIDKHHFKAVEVLAKHDANYMPLEVRNALMSSGKAMDRNQ